MRAGSSARVAPTISQPPMPARTPPVTPSAIGIAAALEGSEPLARLRAALQESRARLDAVRPVLPAALRAHVQPGPVDADGWSLLAANAGVAAKLRHLKPRLEDALRAAGWTQPAVRIRVTSR
jgi:hypothetical protein